MELPAWTLTLVVYLCCIFNRGTPQTSLTEPNNKTEISTTLNRILSNYDTRLRPNINGDPVNVDVDFSVVAISNIHEVNMAFTVDTYFRLFWLDPRLAHNLSQPIILMMGTRHPADYIWVPDAIFENSVKAHAHTLMTNNHKLDIYPNGSVFWGSRATVTATCKMDLRNYPMDKQTCSITVVSYAYPVEHLVFSWRSVPGVILLDRQLAQFYVTGWKTSSEKIKYVIGKYSTLTATFTLNRRMGYYLVQIYIPCMFIVLVASMSFWVDEDSTPARVGLAITTLLTISTVWGAVNASMPKVSYIKAIDWYLMVSFGFIFATFVEYIVVLNAHLPLNPYKLVSRKRSSKKERNRVVNHYCTDNDVSTKPTKFWYEEEGKHFSETYSFNNTQSGFRKMNSKSLHPNLAEEGSVRIQMRRHSTCRALPSKIDAFSRFLFPFAYLLFNLVYWISYNVNDIE